MRLQPAAATPIRLAAVFGSWIHKGKALNKFNLAVAQGVVRTETGATSTR